MASLLLLALVTAASADSIGKRFAYVGLYNTSTDAATFDSAGYAEPSVLIFAVDEATGAFTPHGAVAAGLNASWIATHPSGRFVYVASEVALYKGKAVGTIASFAVNAQDGTLKFINRVETANPSPVFAQVDPSGSYLLVATYVPGAVDVLAVTKDGALERTEQAVMQGPGTHCAVFDPSGKHVLSAVLGEDRVAQYVFSAGGRLAPLTPNPAGGSVALEKGTGPRHIAWHPLRSDRVYVADEGGSDTPSRLTVCEFSKEGTLKVLQTVSTIDADVSQIKMYPAEIAISDDGRFAYVSNRDASTQRRDSVAVFSLDPASGNATLFQTVSTQGWYPRSMTLDWRQRTLLVANQKSNDVVSFKVDSETGLLTPTGHHASSSGALPDAAGFVAFMKPATTDELGLTV